MHHKVDGVAAFLAPIAVKKLLGWADVKGRRFFLVERAQTDKVLTPPLQGDRLAYQLNDVGCLKNAGFCISTGA
jgi:hypothetical protein